mmetsp:Transcript_5620/g.10569  ORF Transcript_5620/g.10569 Transcript_5620/m.10569 type:complete len:116 (+) Transcript_5620:81-428(+)
MQLQVECWPPQLNPHSTRDAHLNPAGKWTAEKRIINVKIVEAANSSSDILLACLLACLPVQSRNRGKICFIGSRCCSWFSRTAKPPQQTIFERYILRSSSIAENIRRVWPPQNRM